MRRFHAQRLLRLARKIEGLPRKNFDMHSWWYKNECGTVGCILGHAGHMPAFNKLGLMCHSMPLFTPVKAADRAHCAKNKPESLPLCNGLAGRMFFGLTSDEADRLFYADRYNKTPKSAARLIRSIVRKHFPALVPCS